MTGCVIDTKGSITNSFVLGMKSGHIWEMCIFEKGQTVSNWQSDNEQLKFWSL